MSEPTFALSTHPVHLGLGARVTRLDPMDGTTEWYERYGAATESDGVEGRLVSMHTFSEPWDTWEMHPHGEELVACVNGTVTLHQELHDGVHTVTLGPGDAVINPAGAWHTADVEGECTAVFITAGMGTEVRPR